MRQVSTFMMDQHFPIPGIRIVIDNKIFLIPFSVFDGELKKLLAALLRITQLGGFNREISENDVLYLGHITASPPAGSNPVCSLEKALCQTRPYWK